MLFFYFFLCFMEVSCNNIGSSDRLNSASKEIPVSTKAVRETFPSVLQKVRKSDVVYKRLENQT